MKGRCNSGPKLNHFCVSINASYMRKLRIPKKFAKTIEESVSKNVKLEGPSGITGHVRMVKSKDTFVLKSGWNNFVTANEIDQNDNLVFTYKGNSSFNVLIFDRSGCEKDTPFFATKIETESEESDDCSVRVAEVPHHEVKKEIISVSSGSDTASANEVSVCSAWGDRTGKQKRRGFVQELSESDEGNIFVRKSEEKKNPKKKFRLYMLPQQTVLNKAQEEIFDSMAKKAQKGSNLFVKILTKTNTYAHRNCVLNIPSGFACDALGNKKQAITLLPANLDRSKGLIANYYSNENIRYISWHRFVNKNRLKEGDLCLFELRKQEIRGKLVLTMVVHFKARSKEPTDNTVDIGFAPHDDEVKKEIISLSSGSDTEISSEMSSHKARAPKRKRRDHTVQESGNSDEGNRPVRKPEEKRSKRKLRPYIVPKKTRLTKDQEELADRIAQKTQKGSDLFVKILTPMNIDKHRNCMLNLPKGFANDVLVNKKEMITLLPADLDKSKGCVAKYFYKMHNVRCISWREFVQKNRLKEGDLCLFELLKQERRGKLVLTMLVHFDRSLNI